MEATKARENHQQVFSKGNLAIPSVFSVLSAVKAFSQFANVFRIGCGSAALGPPRFKRFSGPQVFPQVLASLENLPSWRVTRNTARHALASIGSFRNTAPSRIRGRGAPSSSSGNRVRTSVA